MRPSVGQDDLPLPCDHPHYRERSTVCYDYDAGSRTYARYQDNGAGAMVREVDAANNVPGHAD